MYENDLVSVIIPVYNAEKFLEETINSVINQTYKKLEIVLVDDCSTDNSVEIIKKMQKQHDNIIIYWQDLNQGAAVARNKALMMAKGRYIAFLDSDDIWMPDKIEKQLHFMNERGITFSFANYCLVNELGIKMQDNIQIIPEVNYKYMLTHTIIATPTVIIDREKLGDVQMPLRRTGQDYAFWLHLLRNTNAYCFNEVLVIVRKRPNSLSKSKLQSVLDVWNVQVQFEGINCFFATLHTFFYIINVLKKRLITS